jgi:hypothetical protein
VFVYRKDSRPSPTLGGYAGLHSSSNLTSRYILAKNPCRKNTLVYLTKKSMMKKNSFETLQFFPLLAAFVYIFWHKKLECLTPGACNIKLFTVIINSITKKASVFVKASQK